MDSLDAKTVRYIIGTILEHKGCKPIHSNEPLIECTERLNHVSTALFRALQYVRIESPEIYQGLKKASIPAIGEQWAKVLNAHAFELEREK